MYKDLFILLFLVHLSNSALAYKICTPSLSTYPSQLSNQIIDSLKGKTYQELIDIIYDSAIKLEIKENCSLYFLDKAKKSNNVRRIAEGYRNMSYIASLNGNEYLDIKYLDSIINYTKNKQAWNYPSFAYYIKGLKLYDKRDFKNSLDNFVEGHKYAKRNKNLDLLYDLKYSIATLKSRIGQHKEALMIFKECYEYTKKNGNRPQDRENLLINLHALADEYRRNNEIDSSSVFNRLGIAKTINKDYISSYAKFILSEGINHFIRGDYLASIDSINKSIPILKKINDQPNLSFASFYLGKNYLKLGLKSKSINHFKDVDTFFQIINDLHPDQREAYEFLIDYYKKIEDVENQLLYIEKLIRVDSMLMSNYKYLSRNITQNYDTPELIASKQKLINNIKKDKSQLFIGLGLLFLVVIIFLIMFILNYRKKRYYREKFLLTIKNNEQEQANNLIEKGTTKLDLPEEIISRILEGLTKFENSFDYLQSDITITLLAKKLKTNTKYLSKVINLHRQKSFSNYINDLRITYVIDKLKNNAKFRNYTIKAISESVGFKNSESFSKAFYKKTDIYPSYFIKEFKRQ